ncbi:MAG: helix-turn-helix domain-containing protein [Bacteroidales bacterium]|nr:helix-turn-helix domain-containing protein [candidate division KSB1 bacterium]MBL6949020.1 helix-turn-helix domain-containing protein [Bacteroidales bacterium]
MDKILLHSTSLKEFQEIIGSLIEEKLQNFKPESPKSTNDEYATRRDVCDRLKISLATLHYYTKDGTLKGYRIGGRVLYKWAEVEQSVKRIETIKYKHRGA